MNKYWKKKSTKKLSWFSLFICKKWFIGRKKNVLEKPKEYLCVINDVIRIEKGAVVYVFLSVRKKDWIEKFDHHNESLWEFLFIYLSIRKKNQKRCRYLICDKIIHITYVNRIYSGYKNLMWDGINYLKKIFRRVLRTSLY
jgi:hypothetical protein